MLIEIQGNCIHSASADPSLNPMHDHWSVVYKQKYHGTNVTIVSLSVYTLLFFESYLASICGNKLLLQDKHI